MKLAFGTKARAIELSRNKLNFMALFVYSTHVKSVVLLTKSGSSTKNYGLTKTYSGFDPEKRARIQK